MEGGRYWGHAPVVLHSLLPQGPRPLDTTFGAQARATDGARGELPKSSQSCPSIKTSILLDSQLNFILNEYTFPNLPTHLLCLLPLKFQNLECGSRYHVYLVAHNRVGSSPASDTALVKTLGAAPLASSLEQFLTLNSTSAVAYPETWLPQGCAITHFLVEYRPHHQSHWLQGETTGIEGVHV